MPSAKSLLSCACSLLLLGLTSALAQPGSPAGSGGAASRGVKLTVDTALTGSTALSARGAAAGGIGVSQAGFKLSVPLPPIAPGWFPSVGLDYQHVSLDRDPGTPLPGRLQSLGTSVSVFGRLPADWSLLAGISPKLANAGSGLSGDGLGFGVIALATRKLAPDFSGGLGVVYDSLARGTGRILPIATFDWAPAPTWRVFLGFPRTGTSWQVAPTLLAEFVAEADFGSYYVKDDPSPGGLNRPALDRTRLEYQAVRFGPAITWSFAPDARLRVAAGAVPVLNADYHRRQYKLKADDTVGFASVELGWRF
jgi:hypothetical protein